MKVSGGKRRLGQSGDDGEQGGVWGENREGLLKCILVK